MVNVRRKLVGSHSSCNFQWKKVTQNKFYNFNKNVIPCQSQFITVFLNSFIFGIFGPENGYDENGFIEGCLR